MIIFVHIILISLLSWHSYRSFTNSPLRLYFFPALVVKLAAGIALGLLYFVYYGGGDTLIYHHDAAVLASLARQNFPEYVRALSGSYPEGLDLTYIHQERALLTAKVFSVIHLLTGSNYWLSSCYVSFLSFICLFKLAGRLATFRPGLQIAAALAFLFWPSFVFWTSGLLKESLAMICIAWVAASFLPYILAGEKLKWTEVMVSLILLLFLLQIKYYYAGLLVPVLACLLFALWTVRFFGLKESCGRAIFLICLGGGVATASLLHPNLYFSRFPEVWTGNYYLIAQSSPEGGFVVYENLKADWASVFEHAPKAVFSGLFEPLLQFDDQNIFRMAASAENIITLLLCVAGLAGWVLKSGRKLSLPVLAVLLYIFAFALIMGIAAPNFGAISRYRISYQPFFVLLVLYGTSLLFYRFKKKFSDQKN